MKTDCFAILKNRTMPHTENPDLYEGHDTPGKLKDCPFPLETDSFKILSWGDTVNRSAPGHPGKVAVVQFRKKCGHMARERIAFYEGVQDFDHYGTKFIGADYSVNNWEKRIEFFRQGLCPVCNIYEHCRWAHFHAGERTAPRKRTLSRFSLLMNANFENWRDFVSTEDFEKAIQSPENKTLSLRN